MFDANGNIMKDRRHRPIKGNQNVRSLITEIECILEANIGDEIPYEEIEELLKFAEEMIL
tara:strand:+ start:164 stop:343 length:180 start_codon:yes stop_codon:yes gene_type:complete